MKRYRLEIKYNEITEEIESVCEEILTDESTFYYGGVDVSDYFDEESYELIRDCYILGES